MYGGAPLGRPKKKDDLSAEQKREHQEQSKRRNWIEAKFGEGKRRYGLGLVMAKTQRTSESWIAMVIFVMNIARSHRDLFLSHFYWLVETNFKQTSGDIYHRVLHYNNYHGYAGLWGAAA